MVNKLLDKYDKLAFLCSSVNEFCDCVEFIMEESIKPNIMTDEVKKRNRIHIGTAFKSRLNGKCYFIMSKDITNGCGDSHTLDCRNFDEVENYSDWSDFKIIKYNKILRKNKLKELNNG